MRFIQFLSYLKKIANNSTSISEQICMCIWSFYLSKIISLSPLSLSFFLKICIYVILLHFISFLDKTLSTN